MPALECHGPIGGGETDGAISSLHNIRKLTLEDVDLHLKEKNVSHVVGPLGQCAGKNCILDLDGEAADDVDRRARAWHEPSDVQA